MFNIYSRKLNRLYVSLKEIVHLKAQKMILLNFNVQLWQIVKLKTTCNYSYQNGYDYFWLNSTADNRVCQVYDITTCAGVPDQIPCDGLGCVFNNKPIYEIFLHALIFQLKLHAYSSLMVIEED